MERFVEADGAAAGPESIGAHFSTAGGLGRALDEAARRRSRVAQIFTSSPRQWAPAALKPEDAAAFASRAERERVVVVSHAGYLLNLAQADPARRGQTIDALAAELARCAALRIPLLVIHPGSAGTGPVADGLRLATAALDEALGRGGNEATTILLETTAGQGACLGACFEHLAAILEGSRCADRLGVCIDTCHVFASGYDLRGDEGYDRMVADAGRLVGLERVLLFHLNDSRTGLGSRVDRHAHIGSGEIGAAGFRRLLTDPRFARIGKCLETEDDEERDADFRILRRMLAAGAPTAAKRRPIRR